MSEQPVSNVTEVDVPLPSEGPPPPIDTPPPPVDQPPPPTQDTPEPATLLLCGLGVPLASAFALLRRRKHAQLA